MTYQRISQSNRMRYDSHRKGMAPLELALALPILMVMLSMIFGVCNVTETRMMTTTAARNHAFAKRHQPWLHAQESIDLRDVGKVDRMLGPSPVMPARGGLVTGSAKGVATKMFGPLSDFVWQAESKRFVLGGGWDYQEINFAEHSKLSLPKQATYFGMPPSVVDGFSGIGNLAGAAAGSFGQTQGQVKQILHEARQKVVRRVAEIQSELKQSSNRLNEQKRHLASLQSVPFVDPGALSSMQTEIDKTEDGIKTLKEELVRQQDASAKLGADYTSPGSGSVSASE